MKFSCYERYLLILFRKVQMNISKNNKKMNGFFRSPFIVCELNYANHSNFYVHFAARCTFCTSW